MENLESIHFPFMCLCECGKFLNYIKYTFRARSVSGNCNTVPGDRTVYSTTFTLFSLQLVLNNLINN